MATKVFNPVFKLAKVAKSPPKIDLASCMALANRTRATDVLILCFGIGIGVLVYALVHDIILRFRPEPESQSPLSCDCSTRSVTHSHSHSHHLSTTPHHVKGHRFLVIPTTRRPILTDEKV